MRASMAENCEICAALVGLKEVVRLSLKPADALVLRFPGRLPEFQLHHIQIMMRKAFPDLKVLILEDGADISTINLKETGVV